MNYAESQGLRRSCFATYGHAKVNKNSPILMKNDYRMISQILVAVKRPIFLQWTAWKKVRTCSSRQTPLQNRMKVVSILTTWAQLMMTAEMMTALTWRPFKGSRRPKRPSRSTGRWINGKETSRKGENKSARKANLRLWGYRRSLMLRKRSKIQSTGPMKSNCRTSNSSTSRSAKSFVTSLISSRKFTSKKSSRLSWQIAVASS